MNSEIQVLLEQMQKNTSRLAQLVTPLNDQEVNKNIEEVQRLEKNILIKLIPESSLKGKQDFKYQIGGEKENIRNDNLDKDLMIQDLIRVENSSCEKCRSGLKYFRPQRQINGKILIRMSCDQCGAYVKFYNHLYAFGIRNALSQSQLRDISKYEVEKSINVWSDEDYEVLTSIYNQQVKKY